MGLKKTLAMLGLATASMAAPIKNAEAAPHRAPRRAPVHHVHHDHGKVAAHAFVGGVIGGVVGSLFHKEAPPPTTVVVEKKVVVQTPPVTVKTTVVTKRGIFSWFQWGR